LTSGAPSTIIIIVNDNAEGTRPTPTGPDLILHPVRMRIITALSAAPLTTGELAEHQPDVPPATLYRHLNTLRRGGILAAAEERGVRGAIERRYSLHPGAANVSPADLARATPEDHRRWFAGFIASLLGEFARYTERGTPDLVRDGVGYREVVLNLSDEEFMTMALALNAAVIPHLANPPGGGRRPRILATVVLPAK
jgi:DNA-binding transcriptional ArsR family regulator